MLLELSVVEQRYHAVMEVLSGVAATGVAERYGVSRRSVHTWVNRYREAGCRDWPTAPIARSITPGSWQPRSRP